MCIRDSDDTRALLSAVLEGVERVVSIGRDVRPSVLAEKFFADSECFVSRSSARVEHIFSCLLYTSRCV